MVRLTFKRGCIGLVVALATGSGHSRAGQSCCYTAHDSPGCSTPACAALVCDLEPFCCDVAWDNACVHLAETTCHAPCPGDATGDGAIDVADLTAVIAAWGTDDAFADVDRSCLVDVADLTEVIVHWGQCAAGGCCVAGGSCFDLTLAECAAFDGAYLGDGAFCDRTECTCAGGDCCWLNGNGSPGCDDVTCCKAVCALDPFCCKAEWDAVCADLAQDACTICGPPTVCLDPCRGTGEGERCGTDANGGCNTIPPIFGAIACGETICGTAWSDEGLRDTDWFLFELTEAASVTLTLTAEHQCVAFLVAGVERCLIVVVVDPAESQACEPGTTALELPGIYAVFVSAVDFESFPCGTPNRYEVTLDCSPPPE